MTDKQIIIDGVDVSGCSCHYNGWSQLYRDNRDMCDKGYDLECKPKENGCYHYTKCLEEQLKRKEQECEELKELVKKQKDVLIHKTILADEYESAYLFENTKVAKLKYSLIEIKEIAEKREIFCENCSGGCDEFTCDDCGYVKILQKISECEGNDEQL